MTFSKPGLKWYFVAATSYLTSIHAIHFVSGHPSQWSNPTANERILSLFASKAHITFSILTVGLRPVQLLAPVRTRWPSVHVWLGRVYILGVIGGGIFGLRASFTTNTFPQEHYFFLALSLYWLYTIGHDLRAIWRKDIAGHKRWMTRNYILSYCATLIRAELAVLAAMGWTEKKALTVTSITS